MHYILPVVRYLSDFEGENQMASKDDRISLTLKCTECGEENYLTSKNKKKFKDGDIYLNTFWGDLWVVENPNYIKINTIIKYFLQVFNDTIHMIINDCFLTLERL